MNIDDFLEPSKAPPNTTPSHRDLAQTGVLTDLFSFDAKRLDSHLFFEGNTDEERLISIQTALAKGLNPNVFLNSMTKRTYLLHISKHSNYVTKTATYLDYQINSTQTYPLMLCLGT
jgi:hypothetical protein